MKRSTPPLSEKLAHLSQGQIEDLCKRYPHERNKDLIEEFDLKIYESGIFRILPPIVLDDTFCPNCDVPMWKRIIKAGRSGDEPYCPSCNHKTIGYCTCINCKEERRLNKQKEADRVKTLIETKYGKNGATSSINEIPIIDRLYLAAFIRSASINKSTNYLCLDYCSLKLSPNKYFDKEIVEYLLSKSYIRIATLPEILFPKLKTVEDLDLIDVLTVKCELIAVDPDLSDEELYNRLYYPELNKLDKEELRDTWMKIAKAECFEYIIHKIEAIGIRYKHSDKHLKHIEAILENYSVSQFYCMYFSKLKSANYNRISNGVNPVQVLNLSIYCTLTYAESALINKWPIPKYNRERQCKQSIVSEIFFTLFLKIDQLGFHECPRTFKL
jgi:hypothetical protein